MTNPMCIHGKNGYSRCQECEDDGRGFIPAEQPSSNTLLLHIAATLENSARQLRMKADVDSSRLPDEPSATRRQPTLKEIQSFQCAEDERDWWRSYAHELERTAQPPNDDLRFLLFHVLDELHMYQDFTRNEIADHLRAELQRRGIERDASTKGDSQ